ncbi:hypothetical protein G0Q06_12880 [Puniceicoccales bacterium CK1056]|uniref:Uncharacterized protein n=1 Tax=Oceanipulchritudo coccoides TaxID=2706888 RepID=A0A6B2M4Z2_9BACT|nr:hypothetical protein [Oceanipulchritudo coccoides]NDV63352.1 hypothetical protein [Oceanipulchritudo coccoides]
MLGYTYLANLKDIEEFGPNDLARFPFIGCVYLGHLLEKADPISIQQTYLQLAGYRSLDICFFLWEDLKRIRTDCFVGMCLQPFLHIDEEAPWVSVLSYREGNSAVQAFHPVTEKVSLEDSDPERPIRVAVQESVTKVLAKLITPELERMHYSWPVKTKSSKLPNGPLIQKAIQAYPTKKEFLEQDVDEDGNFFLDSETLNNFKACVPVAGTTIEKVSKYLGRKEYDLVLRWIKPRSDLLKQLRKSTGHSKAELCRIHCIGVPEFFDMVESAHLLPEECFRFLLHIFKEQMQGKYLPTDLIQFETEDY